MNILVTNDDGINARGIFALADVMKPLGKVNVIAPLRNWSAAGHARTLDRPLSVIKADLGPGIDAWSVDGSPADCVALGVNGFLNDQVDLVVSGINSSGNLGQDVLYSGTVSAAMEAAIWGIPAIAVSLCTPDHFSGDADYYAASIGAHRVVRIAIENQMRSGLVLNVNVPYQPVDKILGTQVTRLGRRIYHDLAKKIEDPRGKTFFWLAGETPTGVIEPGTDISAVAEGYISITPLELDHTAYSAISEVSNWDSQQQDNFLVFPQCEMFWREM